MLLKIVVRYFHILYVHVIKERRDNESEGVCVRTRAHIQTYTNSPYNTLMHSHHTNRKMPKILLRSLQARMNMPSLQGHWRIIINQHSKKSDNNNNNKNFGRSTIALPLFLSMADA